MKFQLGDKVVLLHSGEDAEVVDFINKEMALVEVKGVRFPVYLDQIDFPYFDRFSKKVAPLPKPKKFAEDIKKEKATAKYKVGEGVWLSFLPVFDKDVFDDDDEPRGRKKRVKRARDADDEDEPLRAGSHGVVIGPAGGRRTRAPDPRRDRRRRRSRSSCVRSTRRLDGTSLRRRNCPRSATSSSAFPT